MIKDLFSGKSTKSTSYYFKKLIVAKNLPTTIGAVCGNYFYRYKIPRKMTNRIEKVTGYSDRGKEMMIPEKENPLIETDLSSNNDKARRFSFRKSTLRPKNRH